MLSCVWLFVSHELQHARPPCPSPAPGVYSNSCPSSRWCHPTISFSVVPFSSCPQPLPASGSFPMSHTLIISQKWMINKSCYVTPLKETIFHDKCYFSTNVIKILLKNLQWTNAPNSARQLRFCLRVCLCCESWGHTNISETLSVCKILVKMNVWLKSSGYGLRHLVT